MEVRRVGDEIMTTVMVFVDVLRLCPSMWHESGRSV